MKDDEIRTPDGWRCINLPLSEALVFVAMADCDLFFKVNPNVEEETHAVQTGRCAVEEDRDHS